MVLCGPPPLAFSVRQGCQQLLGRALAKLRAHSTHSYRTQAKYSIYGSFMILSPWCYLFYDWLLDLYLQPHYGPWFIQQKTLLPALPWEGFQSCDGETPTAWQALCQTVWAPSSGGRTLLVLSRKYSENQHKECMSQREALMSLTHSKCKS